MLLGTPEKRAARGAKLLDREYATSPQSRRAADRAPWWSADRIDLDTLELASGSRCVLGQLYGSWAWAPVVWRHQGIRGLGNPPEFWYGFALPGGEHDWQALNAAWRHEIGRRRAALAAEVVGT